eukprot:510745-Hanusia_phi.AAC.2
MSATVSRAPPGGVAGAEACSIGGTDVAPLRLDTGSLGSVLLRCGRVALRIDSSSSSSSFSLRRL